MNCPACALSLKQIDCGFVQLDVCSNGCGGVWFDSGELDKVDEMHEIVGLEVLQAGRSQNNVVIDRAKVRTCPKCSGSAMQKVTFDVSRDIQLDSCPTCQGIWLDCSELEHLRIKNYDAAEGEVIMRDFKKKAAAASPAVAKRFEAVLRLIF